MDAITSRSSKKQTVGNARPKNILEAFEHIVDLVENSSLDDFFFEKADAYIRYASRKLRFSPMQTVLLAMFVDRSEDSQIAVSDIAAYTGCRTTRLLRLMDDVDLLEERHYLRASRRHGTLRYRVPTPVINALRKNEPYIYEPQPISDTQVFFDRFDSMMSEMREGEMTHDSLKQLTTEMLEEIRTSVFATELRRLNLNSEANILFIFMAHLFVENNDNSIGFHDIDEIYDNNIVPTWVKRKLRSHESQLFELGLIENVNEDGMANSEFFKLTEQAKEKMLRELNIISIGTSDSGLIKASSLAEKRLVYNPTEKEQVAQLTSILSESRFREVQSRLRKAGMRQGFCCIFHGAPGTGKTETVYQIARQTGRDIMRVDVDKIKSCWVGDSEKNIKALFDRYRNICRDTTLAPILLFNEADAVLGVRMESASRAVNAILSGNEEIDINELANDCRHERLTQSSRHKIGF